MTGFRKKKTVYKLMFEDPDLNGLEVVARAVSVDRLLELQRLRQTADNNPESAERILHALAGAIVSWNLEDEDGTPVPIAYAVCRESGRPGLPGHPCKLHDKPDADPCEYTGLCSQELPFVLTIFSAWDAAVASVPNPSPNDSNDGGTSPELSIPMEPLSPNP